MFIQNIIYNLIIFVLSIKDKLISCYEYITEKRIAKYNKAIDLANELVVSINESKDKYLEEQGNKRTQIMIKGSNK